MGSKVTKNLKPSVFCIFSSCLRTISLFYRSFCFYRFISEKLECNPNFRFQLSLEICASPNNVLSEFIWASVVFSEDYRSKSLTVFVFFSKEEYTSLSLGCSDQSDYETGSCCNYYINFQKSPNFLHCHYHYSNKNENFLICFGNQRLIRCIVKQKPTL